MSRKWLVCFVVVCMAFSTGMLLTGCGEEGSTGAATTMEVPRLASGPISGAREGETWTYLGIPYAEPPVGELRWKEPQPVEPWKDVLACEDFGPACPQNPWPYPLLS